MLGLVELALPEQAGELTNELINRGGLPQGFVVVGGMARYALIEEQEGRWQPPRDIDVIGVEEFNADMELSEQVGRASNSFGVDEEETPVLIPSLESWFKNSVDFTLNAVGIAHTEEGVRIIASKSAVEALAERKLSLSEDTERRVDEGLRSSTPAVARHSHSARTNLPARGAYQKAVLDQLIDANFGLELRSLKLPSETGVNPFYIGLMLVKALQIEKINQKDTYHRAYMNIVEKLGLWNFAKNAYSPAFALQALRRQCPYLRVRSIEPSMAEAISYPATVRV